MRNEDSRPRAPVRVPNAPSQTGSGPSDDECLLKRYLAERDEAAFAALVQRYGPLVLGVCRRVLRHEQDAEDAFQATFMILARKAGSISRSASTGGWLYRVAYRMALKLKGRKTRRTMYDQQLPDLPAPEEHPEWAWREVRVVLDEEINRLPQKYRVPFVLCYLDGKTNEQAAQQLACPVGTLTSRLAWARNRLKGRLTRRGVTLSGGVLASALASHGLAAVPVALAEGTTRGGLQFALGKAATTGSMAASLAREYLTGLFRARLLKAATAVLALAVVVAILVWWLAPGAAGPANRAVAPASAPDQEQIQGVWRFVRFEINGQAADPGNTRVIFRGDQCILDAGPSALPMAFQLDPTQEPKTIDLEYFLQSEPVSGRGIYRLQGDSLSICYHFDSSKKQPQRVADFVTHSGASEMLFVLEREQAEPSPAVENPRK